MVITHALVNFSLSPRLEIWGMSLELGGSALVSCNWVSLLIHIIRVSYLRLMIMM